MVRVLAMSDFSSKFKAVEEFYDEAYSLAHIIRYSMKPVLRQESVAEHSYFVALGVILLHEVYHFDLSLALLSAVAHDIPEMEISDVNHLVKKRFPSLASAIKDAELSIIETLPATLRTGANIYENGSTEAKIVHLADAMQCMQYSSNEMKMGNTGYMEEVYQNSSRRAEALHEDLKGCRKWKESSQD